MRLRQVLLSATLLAAATCPPLFAQSAAIGEIQAKLFFNETATFSENILHNGTAPDYWNAIIGEGDLPGSVTSILFLVRVDLSPGATPDSLKVKITVRERGRFVINRNYYPSGFADNGQSFIPILLNNIGCQNLIIDAAVSSPTLGPPTRATVPFRCGE